MANAPVLLKMTSRDSNCLLVGVVVPHEEINIQDQEAAPLTCVEFCKAVAAVFRRCGQRKWSAAPIGIRRESKCQGKTTLSSLNH